MLFVITIIDLYFSLKLKLLKTVDRLTLICYFIKEGSNVWILGSRKGGVPCTDNLPPYRLRKRTIWRRIAGVVPTFVRYLCLFYFFVLCRPKGENHARLIMGDDPKRKVTPY